MPPPPITLRTFVHDRIPHLDTLVVSEPEPVLVDHNLVGFANSAEDARAVLVDWERIVDADGAIGYLGIGDRSEVPEASAPVDRQTGRRTLRRILIGAVPGAVAFALVVAAVVWLVRGWSNGIIIGAILGGLAFGIVPGAFVTYVRGTGWSAAYEDSHTPIDDLVAAIVSIHADDEALIDDAATAAERHERVRVDRVDRNGAVVRE